MAAAHSRFRRLPGAMRVLAVELCHYVDILISCAAAVSPAAAPAMPALAPASTAATPAAPVSQIAVGGVGAAARQQHDAAGSSLFERDPQNSDADLAGTGEQDIKQQDSPQPSDEAPADQHAVQKSAEEGSDTQQGEQASSARQTQSGSQAPPAVRDLYQPLVAFVLELLSDADAGAKPAEIAAPLQLHLRALQIAQWQSSNGTMSERSARAEGASATVSRGSLDLAAHAVHRLLRFGTPLSTLRCVLAAAKPRILFAIQM